MDGQVSFLPQNASDGIRLRFALQCHRRSCFGFEQSSEDVPREVWGRGWWEKTKELPLACVEHAPVWSLAINKSLQSVIRRTGTYTCTFFLIVRKIFWHLLATQRSQHQRKSGYRQEKNDFLNVFDPTNSSPGWPHYPVIQATFKNDSKLTFKILWQQWFGDLRDR